jgi:YD repeat-containing protein
VTGTPPAGTARTTNYTYDGIGHLIQLAMPGGMTLGYSYDTAHRLVGINDAKGNAVTHTLESSANPVRVDRPITSTASVTGSSPNGKVTLKNGGTTLGASALSGAGDARVAIYTATLATAGAKSLPAVDAGDAVHIASTSAALSQAVSRGQRTRKAMTEEAGRQ